MRSRCGILLAFKPSHLLIAVVAGLGIAVALLLRTSCAKVNGPLIEGRVDTVADTILVQSRPQILTKWRDRIVTKQVPVRVVVSQGYPDTAFAMRYARAALASDSARRARASGDSVARLPQAILPTVSGRYSGSTLDLWLTRSDGSLLRATAKLKPRFAFFSGADKGSDTLPIFQSDRAWVRTLRQAGKCAPAAGVVAGVGALVNPQDRALAAIIGGASTLLGCLIG